MFRQTVSAIAVSLAMSTGAIAQAPSDLSQVFAGYDDSNPQRIDYELFSFILSEVVFDVGPSDRVAAYGRFTQTGTRINRENTSRYRYEGNRVIYHLLTEGQKETLSAYRQELEGLAGQIDLNQLSSNEQLAYWLNLHNAVMMDEIARAYPVREPRDIRSNGVPLEDAQIVSLPGYTISLNDIRHRIVAPIWDDPRVIYGFYTGAVGGPSVQEQAFDATRVWNQLDRIGSEFVNSLRGVDGYDSPTRISSLYFEYPELFETNDEIRAHLLRYADADVRELITSTDRYRAARFDHSIADLTNGGGCSEGIVGQLEIYSGGGADFNGGCRALPPIAMQFVQTIQERRYRMFLNGELGRVTVRDIPTDSDQSEAP